MCVGNRDRQGIGGIRAGNLYARQQPLDHCMNLRLLGTSGSDHRLLD
jgi:hypothetical protein